MSDLETSLLKMHKCNKIKYTEIANWKYNWLGQVEWVGWPRPTTPHPIHAFELGQE